MAFSPDQIRQYETEGYLHLGPLFTPTEAALLRTEVRRLGSPARALADANLINETKGLI